MSHVVGTLRYPRCDRRPICLKYTCTHTQIMGWVGGIYTNSALCLLAEIEQNQIISPVPLRGRLRPWMHLAFISGYSSRHFTLPWCKGMKRSDTARGGQQCVLSAVAVVFVFFPSRICISAVWSGSHVPCLDQTAVWIPRFSVSYKRETDSLALCSFSELYDLILDSSEARQDSSQRIQEKILLKGSWDQHV